MSSSSDDEDAMDMSEDGVGESKVNRRKKGVGLGGGKPFFSEEGLLSQTMEERDEDAMEDDEDELSDDELMFKAAQLVNDYVKSSLFHPPLEFTPSRLTKQVQKLYLLVQTAIVQKSSEFVILLGGKNLGMSLCINNCLEKVQEFLYYRMNFFPLAYESAAELINDLTHKLFCLSMVFKPDSYLMAVNDEEGEGEDTDEEMEGEDEEYSQSSSSSSEDEEETKAYVPATPQFCKYRKKKRINQPTVVGKKKKVKDSAFVEESDDDDSDEDNDYFDESVDNDLAMNPALPWYERRTRRNRIMKVFTDRDKKKKKKIDKERDKRISSKLGGVLKNLSKTKTLILVIHDFEHLFNPMAFGDDGYQLADVLFFLTNAVEDQFIRIVIIAKCAISTKEKVISKLRGMNNIRERRLVSRIERSEKIHFPAVRSSREAREFIVETLRVNRERVWEQYEDMGMKIGPFKASVERIKKAIGDYATRFERSVEESVRGLNVDSLLQKRKIPPLLKLMETAVYENERLTLRERTWKHFLMTSAKWKDALRVQKYHDFEAPFAKIKFLTDLEIILLITICRFGEDETINVDDLISRFVRIVSGSEISDDLDIHQDKISGRRISSRISQKKQDIMIGLDELKDEGYIDFFPDRSKSNWFVRLRQMLPEDLLDAIKNSNVPNWVKTLLLQDVTA